MPAQEGMNAGHASKGEVKNVLLRFHFRGEDRRVNSETIPTSNQNVIFDGNTIGHNITMIRYQ